MDRFIGFCLKPQRWISACSMWATFQFTAMDPHSGPYLNAESSELNKCSILWFLSMFSLFLKVIFHHIPRSCVIPQHHHRQGTCPTSHAISSTLPNQRVDPSPAAATNQEVQIFCVRFFGLEGEKHFSESNRDLDSFCWVGNESPFFVWPLLPSESLNLRRLQNNTGL